MKKLFITVGLPNSGKSSWAEKKSSLLPGSVIINRGDIRRELFGNYREWDEYEHSNSKEFEVTLIWDKRLEDSFSKGVDIIISDTSLNHYYRNEVIMKGITKGYRVICVFFCVPWNTAISKNFKRESPLPLFALERLYSSSVEAEKMLSKQSMKGSITLLTV